jgi:hypothetical protein
VVVVELVVVGTVVLVDDDMVELVVAVVVVLVDVVSDELLLVEVYDVVFV